MKRKTLIIAVLSFLLCGLLTAQKEYNFLAGGALGYRYSEDNKEKSTGSTVDQREHLIQANPVIGLFLTKNLVIGLGLNTCMIRSNMMTTYILKQKNMIWLSMHI